MATTGTGTAFTYMNVGRQGMNARHNVFRVHDIPPAAYFGNHEFKQGEVCAFGLWDEAADEPVAYPFVAGNDGFCYLPNFKEPVIDATWRVKEATEADATKEGERKTEPPQPACTMACRWSE